MLTDCEGGQVFCPEDWNPLSHEMRKNISGTAEPGPVDRKIIKLWYMGNWYPLPDE